MKYNSFDTPNPAPILDVFYSGFEPYIDINADHIASSHWPSMVEQTQLDNHERGLTIARWGSQILISRITKGNSQDFSPQVFPFGVKGFLKNLKTIELHTHPMPESLAHIKTSCISDSDIKTFIANNENRGLIVLDRGGVHLLTKLSTYTYRTTVPNNANIVSDAISASSAKSETIIDVIHNISTRLFNYGLGYYYRPELKPSPEETSTNIIRFKNMHPNQA